jgi:tellurite resistance protein TerC
MISPLGWGLTIAAVVGLLALEMVAGRRRSGAVTLREAVAWSAFYVMIAIAFGVLLGVFAGWDLGTQYFAGYVVEKSLSIDNLFVFVTIMAAFSVPAAAQPRALTAGITIALVLRAAFIAVGAALLHAFSFMFVVFGVVLLVTAVQMLRHGEPRMSVADNALLRAARRRLPISDGYDGAQFVTRVDGRRMATALLIPLLAIGAADVLFALDSIPAVFGVSRSPYIVFCANAFALLGLRALYFLVSGLLERLVYLSRGLSLVLALIGVKLVLEFVHEYVATVPSISTGVSLALIVVILTVTTIASLCGDRRDRRLGTARPPAPAAR